MKFWVVPESSERCTGVTARFGRVLPGLSAAISGAFQFVILPRNMPANATPPAMNWVRPAPEPAGS